MNLSYDAIRSAVMDHAAFRRRQRLQPLAGPGTEIFPSTYPGVGRDSEPRHVYEKRRINGEDTWTALLDSVQSQANRAEEALLAEARNRAIDLPYLTVDFSATHVPEIGEITSLDAPHRIFDAILRDSELDGTPLMKSDLGKALQLAKPSNAGSVFECSPTALLFGAWNSTGEGGGLGAKFPRCYVSEIIAVHVPVKENIDSNGETSDPETWGRRPGSRLDPLGILKGVPVFKSPSDWAAESISKEYKKSKPSEVNHGNIAPSVQSLGVTMDYAEQTMVISFAALRRLRFGSVEKDAASRALLAILGLVAHVAQTQQGYALRSRCDLVCEDSAPLELVHSDGGSETVHCSYDDVIKLYRDAVEAVRTAGFTYNTKPIRLTPQEKLVYLVEKSRQLALEGKGEEAAGVA